VGGRCGANLCRRRRLERTCTETGVDRSHERRKVVARNDRIELRPSARTRNRPVPRVVHCTDQDDHQPVLDNTRCRSDRSILAHNLTS